jgi:HlyD family secretion protein
MPNIFARFSRKQIIIAATILVVFGGIFMVVRNQKPAVLATVTVERRDVSEIVSVTGSVKPAQSIALSFEKGGTISMVGADVGKTVEKGAVLVSLNNADLMAQRAQAVAQVASAQARLDALLAGASPEDIAFDETKLANANGSKDQAVLSVIDKIRSAQSSVSDAVYNTADQLFTNATSPNPQFNIQVTGNSQLAINLAFERLTLEQALSSWKDTVQKMNVTNDVRAEVLTAKKTLTQVASFFDHLAEALNQTQTGAVSQTMLNTYRSNIAAARANINAATTGLISAETSLQNAESAVSVAQGQLTLDKAGARSEDLAAQKATVAQMQAAVAVIDAQISKTVLRAPIAGVITKQDAKVGQIASPNSVLVSLNSVNQFQIEAYVPEADIAKVSVGNSADITLDAYGSAVVFQASVISVDPGETITDGVATYLVKFQFTKPDARIKSGMTANLDIHVGTHLDVLAVPGRTISSQKEGRFVSIVDENGSTTPQKVEIGLRGSDGFVEIVSGLSEGEKITASVQD